MTRSPAARRVVLAIRRARYAIILSAATYVISALIGIAMVTAGVPFAVQQRDAIVGSAQGGPVLEADKRGDRVQAAMLDFGMNLVLGAGPSSILGLSIVGPFPIAAYRGWVGGIVSIDGAHTSRLASPSSARYYVVTMLLQLAGFTLAMAAGIHVGVAAWRARNDPRQRSIAGVRIPGWSLRDAASLYALAVPLLMLGSLWEFMA